MALPPEDNEEGKCALLKKSLYGTRDAPRNWEFEYADFHVNELGFTRGISSPCAFYHKEKNLRVVVHGDDFTVLGADRELDWYRREMQKKYSLKVRGRLGPEKRDDKSIRILNRIVRWTEDGVELEADPRHAEILVEQMGLQRAKGVSTPGVKPEAKHEEEDQKKRGEKKDGGAAER